MDKSYNYLLSLKCKSNYLLYACLFIISLIILISFFIKTYDTYQTYAIFKNNQLLIEVPINDSDKLIKGKFFRYENNKYNYNYKVKNISDVMQNNGLAYQIYYIDTSNDFIENETILITFYYNKEKIVKKIIKTIF